MRIQEEVQTLKQQGYNDAQIKNSLTEKGYDLNDINQELNVKPAPPKPKKKLDLKLLLLPLFAILIIIIGYMIITPNLDNPKNWVIEKEDGSKEIDIETATQGFGDGSSTRIQYDDGNIKTVFEFEGVYKGNVFKYAYYDESGKPTIQIVSDMTPNDGIIEAYIIEKIENENLYAYVFVDEDWKNLVGENTNIIWGKRYDKIQKFDFSNDLDGIYVNKILDDITRFNEGFSESTGGVMVGNMELSDFDKNETSKDLIAIRIS